jgi:parallel beta-helix repeat protein
MASRLESTRRTRASHPSARRRMAFLACAAIPLIGVWALGSMGVLAADPSGVAGVAGSSGQVSVQKLGSWRELTLPGSAARDIDLRFRFKSDTVATGRGQSVVVVARRGTQGEYRVRITLTESQGASVSVVRRIGGVPQEVRPAVQTGIAYRPGTYVAARVKISGSDPTVIKAKIWWARDSQPAAWTIVARDSSTALSGSGAAALRFAVSGSSSEVPVVYSFDHLTNSTVADDPTPDPSPSPTSSLSSTASASATPSPSSSATPSPAPTSTPRPTSTPSPTPTAPPSPTPSSIPPNSYFVARDGSDSASGSQGSPWRTLQKAADSAPAGSTVLVRGGEYAGFVMRRSGTAAAPITFASYPGESAVVDGNGQVPYTIQLTGVAHVNVLRLTVRGGYAERQQGGGILVNNSSYVELRDNVIRDNHSFGVRTESSTHVLVDGNDVFGNAVGVHIGTLGEGTVVSNNLIHDNNLMMVNTADVRGDDAGAEGVAIVHTSGHVEVVHNQIWGNRAQSYDYGYDGGAFSIYAASNWVIRDNVTWDNRNILETGTDSDRTDCNNGTFVHNLNYAATTVDRTVGMVLRCASNTLVANNTFVGMQYFVFDISHMGGSWGGSIEGLRVINNVVSISTGKVYGIDTKLPSSVVIDNNIIYKSGSGYLATYLTEGTSSLATLRDWTGAEMHGTTQDPLFSDPARHDYTLSAGSPAIDSAWRLAGVTDDYNGSAPDRGYDEAP